MKKNNLFLLVTLILCSTINLNAKSTFKSTSTSVNFSPDCTSGVTASSSNFNGTSIQAGNYIWFNSVLKVTGVGSTPVTIAFVNQTITIGNNIVVDVPDSYITISSSNTMASTEFNGSRWINNYPTNTSGKNFLSGYSHYLDGVGLPGGVSPVVWRGNFYSNNVNIQISWQWSAAVYTTFSTNHALLGVKPTDSNNASIYLNSNHAGSPQNFKEFVTGGARGGGGSNYTGSYSGTKTLSPCDIADIEPIKKVSQTNPLISNDEIFDIQLYPNPVDDTFSLNSKHFNENTQMHVYIYNSQNALIFEKNNVLNDQKIDMSYLPRGIYFVNIINDTTNKFIKVIKK